jgi:replication factor C subunit 2/4
MFTVVPHQLDKFILNDDKAKYLTHFIGDNMVNILFIGRPNCGKKTICNAYLNYIFNITEPITKSIGKYNLKIGTNEVEIDYLYTPYYYEINLYEYGLYDKHIISHFIQEFISYKSINNKKRIVILNHFDKVSQSAQNALRRIIEIYSNVCIFILIAEESSKINKALLSRFLMISISYPSKPQIYNYIDNKIRHKALTNSPDVIDNIISNSEENLFKLNYILELYLVYGKIPELNLKELTYQRLYTIIDRPSLDTFIEARKILYDLVLLNISLIEVFRNVVIYYVASPTISLKYKSMFIHDSTNIQSKMCKTEHDIIGLEYLILKVKKYIQLSI